MAKKKKKNLEDDLDNKEDRLDNRDDDTGNTVVFVPRGDGNGGDTFSPGEVYRLPKPSISPPVKPRNDAYVMMLAITFLALVTGCVLMYLDAAQYEGKNPPQAVIPALPELGKAAAPSGPATK